MNRRELFKRLTGGLAVVAAGTLEPRAGDARRRNFGPAHILDGSLVLHTTEDGTRCDFSTLATPPPVGSPVAVHLPSMGLAFAGYVREVRIDQCCGHAPWRAHVVAEDAALLDSQRGRRPSS
jgi:hypothetical protein